MAFQETQDATYIIADVNNRVRTLEGRYNLFGERLLVINQNMIEEYKKVMRELKALNEDMREMRAEMTEVKSAIRNVVAELQLFAKKDDVKVLEKYLNLWSPANFVTEGELDRAIDEKLMKATQLK